MPLKTSLIKSTESFFHVAAVNDMYWLEDLSIKPSKSEWFMPMIL